MQANQHARLFSRWLERTPDAVSLGLVIVCGFLLARLVWMFFPTAPRPLLTDATTPASITAPANAAPSLGDKLAGYHLFGQFQPNASKPATTNIQPTQLALKLQGVYAPAGNKGYAVIEENGQQKAYGAGDPIGNSGAVLDQVASDHVLLRRNGLLEKLALPEAKLGGGGGGAAPAGLETEMPADMPIPDMGQPPPDMMPPPEMFTPAEGAVPPPQTDAPAVEPAQPIPPEAGQGAANLGDFRQSVLNNNMRLLEVASPQPYERDGKFLGFQLSPGSNVALFNQLGLQAGDIVTSINGTALDSPATAMRMLQEAGTASQVSLNLTRNGQEISLPINFQ